MSSTGKFWMNNENIHNDDGFLYTYLSSVQEKLFRFYEEGKLVDVTWEVGSDGNNEVECVEAHSSICALSNRLKELLLNHSGDKEKKLIRVPSTLTSSVTELKLILHLAYTGSFKDDRPITDYIALCEKFDMPLGFEMCSRALRTTFRKAFLQPSIDVDERSKVRDLFIGAFEATKSIEIQKAALDMFQMHPLLFNDPSCLSKVSVDWVLKVLKEKKLWMQDAEGYVYFGRSYIAKVSQLLKGLCVAHRVDHVKTKFGSMNSMLAPLHLEDLDSTAYGFHADAYDYDFSYYNERKYSHANHPPNQWKICAITGHITKSWDGIHALAGLDITYENLATGEKDEVKWGHENEEHFTKQTIQVPEDDVITGFIINSGWLIDKLVFTTLRGMHLDALGSSDGGDRAVFEPSVFQRQGESSNLDDVVVSLHGISYIDITSQGQFLMNEVQFHFSCIDRELVSRLNPDQKEWAYEALRNKKIIL
ncbi:hypothetical protein Aperf_G00000092249 [Anoplocephala perfoliata]